MERKQTRKEQAIQTRKKILDVCTEILSKHSFDEMNIAMICKQADISVGAFYHHFKNKSDIIIELYRDIDAYFMDAILQKCIASEPIEAIILYLCEQCHYAETIGIDSVKNIYKAQIDNGNDFFASHDRGLPDGLRKLILRAKDEGLLTEDTDIEALLDQLLILSRGVIYYWCIKAGAIDMTSYVRYMSGTYLSAFLKTVSIDTEDTEGR